MGLSLLASESHLNHCSQYNPSLCLNTPSSLLTMTCNTLQGAMSSLGLKDCYVGSKAQSLRGILSISHPIRQVLLTTTTAH